MIKNKKKSIFIILVGVVILLAVYVLLSVYFNSHFYWNTTINGISVGTKNIESVKDAIQTGMDEYELVIIERDETRESVYGKEFGLTVKWNTQIASFLENQNGFLWIKKLFYPDVYECELSLSFDEKRLEEVLYALPCMEESKQIVPKNAAISEYSKENGYSLIPSVAGSQIDAVSFLEKVTACIRNLEPELDLEEAVCYVLPEITDDNETLLAVIRQLNTSLQTVITYQVGKTTQILDAEIFQPWFLIDEEMQFSLDEEALNAYVKSLASAYNTSYKTKKLMTSYGVEVTLSNGDYGWMVDRQAEREAITESIKKGEQITRDLNYSMTANSHEGNDYGNSYVEINLTAQHLFLYVDGALIVESDFVSGNVSRGYDTPTGAFPVTYKERNAMLNGETHVSYWMPFAGNVGMHDATWRRAFGGNIYQTNGSHGCINLPYDAAKTIYEHITAGFPVLVYKLPGTEPVLQQG